MYKLNDIKKLKKRIEDLQFLKMYFYSKYKKNEYPLAPAAIAPAACVVVFATCSRRNVRERIICVCHCLLSPLKLYYKSCAPTYLSIKNQTLSEILQTGLLIRSLSVEQNLNPAEIFFRLKQANLKFLLGLCLSYNS